MRKNGAVFHKFYIFLHNFSPDCQKPKTYLYHKRGLRQIINAGPELLYHVALAGCKLTDPDSYGSGQSLFVSHSSASIAKSLRLTDLLNSASGSVRLAFDRTPE